MKKEKEFVITNRLGLHARAAASLVKTANKFRSQIYLANAGRRVNAKSIMGVLTLSAGQNTSITVSAIGPDCEEAVAALGGLIENKFGEEQ